MMQPGEKGSARRVREMLGRTFPALVLAVLCTVPVWGQADLYVSANARKTAPVGVSAGLDIFVHNHGPNAAYNVVLTVRLPEVASISPYETGCGEPSGGFIRCVLRLPDPLEPDTNKWLGLTYTYSKTGAITAEVSGTSDQDDHNPSNNIDTAHTKFYSSDFSGFDLALTAGPVPSQVRLGEIFEYRFQAVHDNGWLTAQRVELIDRLPQQLEFVSSDTGCRPAGGFVRCVMGELAPGQVLEAGIRVRAAALGSALNIATASAEIEDGYLGDNSVSSYVTVVEANRAPSLQTEPLPPVLSGARVPLRATPQDPDGDTLQTVWSQTAGPEVELSGADTATAVFIAPFVTERTVLGFTVQTSDGELTAEQSLEVEVSPSVSYFPQLGNGVAQDLRFQTEFSVANTGSDSEFLLEFYSPTGEALALDLEDAEATESIRMALPSEAARTFRTSGSGPIGVGYARLKSTVSMGAVAVFSRFDESGVLLYEAGVPASREISRFSLLVDTTGERDTGVALLNPPCSDAESRCGPATLLMRLYDADLGLIATRETVLEAGRQTAQFVREFFPDHAVETQDMRGLLTVVSDRPVVAVSLRQDHPSGRLPDSVPTLFALPVIPGAPGLGAPE